MPGHEPRRILYHYRSLQLDTGSPKALLGLIETLDRNAYQPCFMAAGEGPLIDAMRERGVELLAGEVASVTPRRPWWSFRRLQLQRRRLREWNVALVHLNEFGWNTDMVLAARLERVPVVLHVHNPVTVHWQNLNRLAADRVLTVSRSQVDTVQGFHRIRSKHQVLYNTIDLPRFTGGTSKREELGWRADEFVVMTVAQICHRKGVDLVLEIARQLVPRYPSLRFVIVGPPGVGEEAFSDSIRRAAQAPELDGRVDLLGSRQDIPDLLASGDAFLFPTRAEPFGIAVVEALATGLPIVASAVGGVPEILNQADIGILVPVDDVDGFASAIERLVLDRENARAMGRRGAESVMGRFDTGTLGVEVDRLYRSLLAAT